MTSQAFDKVRDALAERGAKFAGTRQNHFMATCPHHEDKNPSLGVDDKGDRVLVRCYADCNTDDVVAAMGLQLRDLFDGEPDTDNGLPVRSYVYRRSTGEPAYIVDRWYPKTFRGRLPDTVPGDTAGLKGVEPILFHADTVWQKMRLQPTVVWLLDGEKDVETAEQNGLVATCPPGFGKRWRDTYTKFLRHASEVVIVADQDPLKADGTLGKGQAFAVAARNALKGAGVPVRVLQPAVGKDLSDHFAGGYGVEDFVPEPKVYTRPRGMKADSLMDQEFEEVCWAVEGLLPCGLTIAAGSPKVGKSWLALDLCLAVAAGGPALSHLTTQQGSTLYLAREDNYRRLQSRMSLILGGRMDDAPPGLEMIPSEHEWQGGDEGLAHLSEWAEEVGNPRLVVLDTLAKVEPDMGEDTRRGAYTGNYSMMAKYHQWAHNNRCAVLAIHHDRKEGVSKKTEPQGMESDPFSRISGTRGLTGAADTLWFLDRVRGTRDGALYVTGRDVEEQTVRLHKVGPLWTVVEIER